MKTITVNFSNMHLHGDSFYQYLCLRKKHFIDVLQWQVPHDSVSEMDQYDTPNATYILIEHEKQVVAGVRVLDFDSSFGVHTCMLNDFFINRHVRKNEKLRNILADSKRLWEGTRLVISDEISDAKSRNICLQLIILGIENYILSNEGGTLMTVSSPLFVRKVRQLGYCASQVSPRFDCLEDGKRYAILAMKFPNLVEQKQPPLIEDASAQRVLC